MNQHSEHFEAWAEKAGYATQRTFSGYVSPLTQCAWLAWQASSIATQEKIAALRAAALQPVMSRQEFGTPGTIEFYRCVFCNHDARTPDIDHDSDCAVREAGYLGGGG